MNELSKSAHLKVRKNIFLVLFCLFLCLVACFLIKLSQWTAKFELTDTETGENQRLDTPGVPFICAP